MIAKYKERFNNLFKKKINYKLLYENKKKECDKWEFKYNKLHRQINGIIKENT